MWARITQIQWQLYKSHNAPVSYPTMYHVITEIWPFVHIFITAEQIIATIVHFRKEYQNWYTHSLRIALLIKSVSDLKFKMAAIFQDGRHWLLNLAIKSEWCWCQIIHFWIRRIRIWNHWLTIASLYTFSEKGSYTTNIFQLFVSVRYGILAHFCTIKCFVINCSDFVIKIAIFGET